jgi:hypothetical protein
MSDDNNEGITMPSQASEWRGILPSQRPSIRSSSSSQCRHSRLHISDSEDESPSPSVKTKDYTTVSRLTECNHLTDENWHEWKDRMLWVLYSSDIAEYVSGFKKRPDPSIDHIGAQNWDKNHVWAQQVIINNIIWVQGKHKTRSKAELLLACSTCYEYYHIIHPVYSSTATQLR